MIRLIVITLLSILFIAPAASVADIYKYTAPNGKIYYSDKPKNKYYKRLVRSRPYRFHNTSFRYRGSLKYFPKNKKRYAPIIQAAAKKYKLDPNLLHAVIYTESAYNARAVSSAGAVGLMQLMPATARRFGVINRRNPVQNVNGGAKYLKYLLELFNSNMRLAIAAYNAGEGAVKKYNNRIPPYPETRRYVKKVMRLYRKA